MKLIHDLRSFVTDIIQNRAIFKSLVINDFRQRYLGSYLGILWAFIQPVITVFIFWFVFEEGFTFSLVRNQDVPAYVVDQVADLGVVGLDVLKEKQMGLMQLLDLGIGKCRVCVGMKREDELDASKPEITAVTKMERIAREYFSSKAMAVKVIKLYGSIMHSSAHLIANKNSYIAKKEEIMALYHKISETIASMEAQRLQV